MPAKMHSFYLRNMYQHNRLREPGAVTLLGKPIDLGKVQVPVYFLSAREDYVAPWKSTYAGTRLLGGPVRFVLGGSGHIAAVLNPVGSPFYGYATNDELPLEPDAVGREGSASRRVVVARLAGVGRSVRRREGRGDHARARRRQARGARGGARLVREGPLLSAARPVGQGTRME